MLTMSLSLPGQWVEGPLLSALYTDNANSMHAEIGELSTLIGSIRIRQVRAKPQKCPNSLNLDEANFQRFKRKNGVVCMSDQVDFSFQTDSFGPGGKYKYYEPTSDLYERVIEGPSRTTKSHIRSDWKLLSIHLT